MQSAYKNLRMTNLRVDITMMANGVRPVVLRGYTMRAMKMGPSYKEGHDWRALCMRCNGEGTLDPTEVPFKVKHVDVRGRLDVCFSCDGKGLFPLPKPELYKEFLILWLMEKVEQGGYEEILTVAESEFQYLDETLQLYFESAEDVPQGYEAELLPFWEWVLRRLDAVKKGAPFFTSLDKKYVDRYNRLHASNEPPKAPVTNLDGAYDAVMKILEEKA